VPTQYTLADSGQLVVLCILDLTEEAAPPADAMSNLSLETPPLHGFEDGAPSHPAPVSVVIADGNLYLPTDYSR